MKPEDRARVKIDEKLRAAGWVVQDLKDANLTANRGVAIREAQLPRGNVDYGLFVDGKALGSLEAKPEGYTLAGVELQSIKYAAEPGGIATWKEDRLPFTVESTGTETWFTNHLDPEPRSRPVFSFHRPETLLEWAQAEKQTRRRLGEMPTLATDRLWRAQIQAIQNLEVSLANGRPRALIQMATGAGKTFTAVNFIYRLIKYGGAKRVLFLVDRGNLGRQTYGEFQQFVSPANNYKFTEEFIVQHLSSNALDTSARVVIGTIQRVYSMLRGETETAPDLDDLPIDGTGALLKDVPPVEYNPRLPIEAFDVIVTDECHRSIYNLWRQVLEYFDAFLIGLTATPSKQTFGFFQQNLVMEYGHDKAVADGVNVGYDVYRIETEITKQGSKVDAGFYVDRRDRQTRKKRWEQLDDDFSYAASQLDRDVVSDDQIRTVLRTFKDKLLTELFPGRADVPKTLIFAKDDSHAEDIVRICREVFDKGNEFCQKITYRTTGVKPEVLLQSFRISYNPRIAVTVDMIATGTDIKPLEVVFFMRSVQSRNFFEQMKGRGVRIVSEAEMEQVNPGIKRKTRFILVDAVGLCVKDDTDSRPLDRKRTVSFEKLLSSISLGQRDADTLEALASRLKRLETRFDAPLAHEVTKAAKGQTLGEIAKSLLDAANPDTIEGKAKELKTEYGEPTAADVKKAKEALATAATAPLASNPDLRNLLLRIHDTSEQVIDVISKDRVLFAGASEQATESARTVVTSFRDYIDKHKAEIEALQILYSRPYAKRLTEPMLKDLEQKLRENHGAWTEDRLWDSFAAVEPKKVKGRSQPGRFADLVSLVRFAIEREPVLQPFGDSVQARFDRWLATKQKAGTSFDAEQGRWLEMIRDHIATSVSFDQSDFDFAPFSERGGLGRAHQLFGPGLPKLIDELNEALAA